MNDWMKEFEEELGGLKPVEPGERVREGIGAALDGEDGFEGGGVFRLVMAMGMAAVFALAGALAMNFGGMGEGEVVGGGGGGEIVKKKVGDVEAEVVDVGPTVLAYRRAWDRSPEAFEALLDHHALTLGGEAAAGGNRLRDFFKK